MWYKRALKWAYQGKHRKADMPTQRWANPREAEETWTL